MLTADLVGARRRGGVLHVPPLDPQAVARVEELAAIYLEIARTHVGRSRDELEATWRAVALDPRERRLGEGVLKLVSDRCVFESAAAIDPAALRAEVFLRARAARQEPERDGALDRAAILSEVAGAHGVSPDELERLLYADLHGAERLCAVTPIRPAHLAAGFDLAQMQAVLLRATKIVAEVASSDVAAYRRLFHKLKFLRLLHSIRATENGYRIEIDGPFSLFQAVTRYGLQLALALPAIAACGRWRIEADVLWGKERRPVTFRAGGASDEGAGGPGEAADPALPQEIAALLDRLATHDGGWSAAPARVILNLPGAGICVPDLVFRPRGASGATTAAPPAQGPRPGGARPRGRRAPGDSSGGEVYLEVMGFWSREAVWRRVEMVERGLPHRILFAVSKQLRVSEAALGDDLPGSLYVYARTLDHRAILERVQRLAGRETPPKQDVAEPSGR